MAHDAGDVGKVLAYARRTGTPRDLPRRRHEPQRPGAADGILVDVRRHSRASRVEDGGARARA